MTMTIQNLKQALRNGPYAEPSGYPTYFLTDDGFALCHKCIQTNYQKISYSTQHNSRDGWTIVGHEINHDDDNLYCKHCNEKIESALWMASHFVNLLRII